MLTQELTVKNKLGLHARPCALLSKTANLFRSSVTLSQNGRCVDAKSILGVMTMAMPTGSVVTLTVDGPDEKAALEAICELFENRFGEAE